MRIFQNVNVEIKLQQTIETVTVSNNGSLDAHSVFIVGLNIN